MRKFIIQDDFLYLSMDVLISCLEQSKYSISSDELARQLKAQLSNYREIAKKEEYHQDFENIINKE